MVKNIHDSLYFLITGYEPLFWANTSTILGKSKKNYGYMILDYKEMVLKFP